ncbi:MAG TPA: ATP-binding cassette domain-containing protein [Polyangiaceae bacterium]
MIEVEKLTKDYGTTVAVKDLSFRVAAGEIVGFLGPNGAGKSTTLRILAGFLGATAGTVRVGGFDVGKESLAARRALGYMPEAAPLYPELRVREYLEFRAALKRVPRRERKSAVARALEQSAVSDVADTLIGHLSKGYRQRVALADALVSNPPLLILDEPTSGLDPNQILEVRRLVKELGKSHTLLLSTHILSEVEVVCDRAIVIARGRLVGEGSLAELKARQKGRRLALVVRGAEEAARRALAVVPGVSAIECTAGTEVDDAKRLTLDVSEDAEPDAVAERAVAALVGAGLGVRSVTRESASLEDVFRELTRGETEGRGNGES